MENEQEDYYDRKFTGFPETLKLFKWLGIIAIICLIIGLLAFNSVEDSTIKSRITHYPANGGTSDSWIIIGKPSYVGSYVQFTSKGVNVMVSGSWKVETFKAE